MGNIKYALGYKIIKQISLSHLLWPMDWFRNVWYGKEFCTVSDRIL